MDASATPGTVIAGKYVVEHTIASGGLGVVVAARHATLGSKVAIKLLRDRQVDDAEAVERFFQEARIAARLPSEHVAFVVDLGVTDQNVPFAVMELLEGNDLAAEIAKRGRMPIEEAVSTLLQACEGVAFAHAAGLVHRDLKPANLFLQRRRGRPPHVKVLDFGLSKAPRGPLRSSDSLTNHSIAMGTPQYMSPEQIRSAKDVDARADQHAIGLILFELVTGKPAFSGPTALVTMGTIVTVAAPRMSETIAVPAALDDAVNRMLAKAREDRFPSLVELAVAIAPFGGPHAEDSVATIRAALSPRTSAPPPSDHELTRKRAPVRASDDEPAEDARAIAPLAVEPAVARRTRLPIAVAAAAVALAIAGAVALFNGSSTSTATATDAAAASDAPLVAPPSSLPSALAAAPAAPVASASASPAPRLSDAPLSPRTSPRGGNTDGIKVFGGKRK